MSGSLNWLPGVGDEPGEWQEIRKEAVMQGAHRYKMMYLASLDAMTSFDGAKPGVVAEMLRETEVQRMDYCGTAGGEGLEAKRQASSLGRRNSDAQDASGKEARRHPRRGCSWRSASGGTWRKGGKARVWRREGQRVPDLQHILGRRLPDHERMQLGRMIGELAEETVSQGTEPTQE